MWASSDGAASERVITSLGNSAVAIVAASPAGERVELAQLGGKLELELTRVHALGLGDHEATAGELELELQLAIALAQRIIKALWVAGCEHRETRRAPT